MAKTEMPTKEREQQQERDRRTVETRRVTTGVAQKMQRNTALADVPPPSLEELQARQDAMSTTRRRTKPEPDSSALDDVNPETLPVPDVAPTSCDE